MSKLGWARMLEALYQRGGYAEHPRKNVDEDEGSSVPRGHRPTQETDTSATQLTDSLGYLMRVELARWDTEECTEDGEFGGLAHETIVGIHLTEEGFAVAHERELRDRRRCLGEAQNRTRSLFVLPVAQTTSLGVPVVGPSDPLATPRASIPGNTA